jgi:predicted RNA binding protein YcfA (HicA-like mRNA interferase family)
MPKIPVVSGQKAIKVLQKIGFEIIPQNGLLRQIGLNLEDFVKVLK